MSKGNTSSLNNLSDENQIRQMEIDWGDAFFRRDIDALDRVTGRSTFRGRYKGWSMAGRYQYTDVLREATRFVEGGPVRTSLRWGLAHCG